MRVFGAPVTTILQGRSLIQSRLLLWITALDRSTQAPYTIGFWNGPDHQSITVNGSPRTYYAAGNIMEISPYTVQSGLNIRTWEWTFNKLTPEALTAIYTYDSRMAPVEVHQVFLDPDTEELVDTPQLIFVGRVNKLTPVRGIVGQPSKVTLELVSNTRDLTRTLPTRYSHESQQLRGADDFFQYSSITESVQIFWGTDSA